MHESRYIESTRFRFQDERLLKVCKSRHNFVFSLDRGFKKNWETEYLKYLDHLKCKVTKKNSNAIKTQQHPSPPPPQIGHGCMGNRVYKRMEGVINGPGGT